MLGRNSTTAFHDLLCEEQNMTPLIHDSLKGLFTTENVFTIIQNYGHESTNSNIENYWTEEIDKKLVPVTRIAAYEKAWTLLKFGSERLS